MHTEKKKSKEDTWKAADLKKYIAEGGSGDGRRGDDRRNRGDSVEKHHKESRREKEKHSDHYIREKGDSDELYGHAARRKEGSQDRRSDREKDTREERHRDKERRRERDRVDLSAAGYMEKTERRREREETQDREGDNQRHRVKDKRREKYTDEERTSRRQEKEKEARREERKQEYKQSREPTSHENIDKRGSEYVDKYNKERQERHRERDRHSEEYKSGRSDKERRERHEERKQSEHKERKDYQEDRRKGNDERERRHKERLHDEKQKHRSESRDHQDQKRTEDKHQRRDKEAESGSDKHRETRPKEQKDPERNVSEKTRDKDKELQQNNSSHTQKAEETKIVTEDEPEQEYEDDFEEYEDDFDEELDESDDVGLEKQQSVEDKEELSPETREEVKAIQRAMDEENKKVGALSRQNTTENEEERPNRPRESERTESKTSQHGKFMDFVAAKQREVNKKVATKQKKRSTELLRLIDLDFTLTSSLLDLPPVNEYDMYIRNFGGENTKQVYVQCNEDNVDRDIQTEEIELCEKWTQHPPEHSGACGDPNISPTTRDGAQNHLKIDSKRLTQFLQSASQVMVVLLEEGQAERNSLGNLKSQTDVLSFSDGSLHLNTKLPFLHGRHISLIHFSQVQKHTMISVHTSTNQPSAVHLDNHALLCIWNIWEPSRPQKILLYESEVQCCCFSPGKVTLVFAGTTVGSVVLWDLREHAGNHHRMTFGAEEWTFRRPSFSTDAVMSASGHFSTVTSVEVVPSSVASGQRSDVSLLASGEEATGLSFQLASLDESGILNFWVVLELPKSNEAGSQTDLGLRPGGKVKLLHSSSLAVADRMSHRAKKSAPLQTLQLKFHPSDSNEFFIGTNMGIVHHGTSHGLKALPKFYTYQEGQEKPVDINSVSFSPFRQDLFLVGCGDGCIRLHAINQEKPLMEWRDGCAGQSVVALQWSPARPAVFSALDAVSNIHLWDLLKNETQPVITERMGKDRVTAMALFGDSGQRNAYSGVALAHESGKIHIQYFANDFTAYRLSEVEQLNSLLEAF